MTDVECSISNEQQHNTITNIVTGVTGHQSPNLSKAPNKPFTQQKQLLGTHDYAALHCLQA